VQDQPNELDPRTDESLRQRDDAIERLTSEVTSLKLELATLISAVKELQYRQPASRRIGRAVAIPDAPRPSVIPAAVVVLLVTGLLSWQLIASPPSDRESTRPNPVATTAHVPEAPAPEAPAPQVEGVAAPVAEAPVVQPTIYKGTLSVNADRPGATVFVNHRKVGTAPVRVRNLRAGSHLVWIERDGYQRWTKVITVPAERVTRVSADLEPLPEPVIEH
jgi:hypothetical protein